MTFIKRDIIDTGASKVAPGVYWMILSCAHGRTSWLLLPIGGAAICPECSLDAELKVLKHSPV